MWIGAFLCMSKVLIPDSKMKNRKDFEDHHTYSTFDLVVLRVLFYMLCKKQRSTGFDEARTNNIQLTSAFCMWG